MKLLVIIILIGTTLIATGSISASSPPRPQVTINKLRAKVAALRADKADLRDQIKAQNQEITDLQTQLANQPDPVEQITNRSPDAKWTAVAELWRSFPTLGEGQLCGYMKDTNPGDGIGLRLTTFTFGKWSGC